MADQELSVWRMDHELQCARAPRLDGLRHVGWLYENKAEGICALLGHKKKAQLDAIRRDGFTTYPIYAGPQHAGTEPQS